MNHWLFLFRIKQKRVVQALAQAEAHTSGEIRVFLTHKKCTHALVSAKEHFDALGMAGTKHRNAVLIFIAPRTRTFAVVGDHAVHEKCGDAFWGEVANAMSTHLREGNLTDAIVHAVEKTGALLAEHFPPDVQKDDELPNQIATD